MATASDGRASYESSEPLRKRPFRTESNEELQNVSQEAGQNNSTGVAYQGGKSASISFVTWILELEQMLKQKTFTRSEAQRVIALVHLRTMEDEESPSSLLRLEPSSTISGPLKKRKSGEEITSLADLSNKDNSIVTGQAPIQYPKTPMASPQHPTTIENIPEELLLNIFMRLLAKQLAQMRSVSKSWNALLSQSSFIKFHLNRSYHNNDNNDQIFLYFPCDESASGVKAFTIHSSRSPHSQRIKSIKLPVNPHSENKGIRVIGAVNGLICSSYDDSIIHIWNPSLSAVITLLPYCMPSVGFDSIRIFFRFGYDPNTDDYKVLKLTGLIRESRNVVKWWLDVEMYSMRKGTWELITDRVPKHLRLILDDDRICVDGHDGHLHWLGCIGEKNDIKTILAFDMGSETFREIPLPDSTLDKHPSLYRLGVLAGKLYWMSWDEDDDTCQVWVMEEYGVVESWVKSHVVSPSTDHTNTFGFTLHNEFFYEEVDGSLVFYDPIADESTILENYFPEEDERLECKFVEYVDSLVWVAPAKHEMVDGGKQN